MLPDPIVEVHQGVHVVRDDLLYGGTKRRFIDKFVSLPYSEFVYASPVYGGRKLRLRWLVRCKENKQLSLWQNAMKFIATQREPKPPVQKYIKFPMGICRIFRVRHEGMQQTKVHTFYRLGLTFRKPIKQSGKQRNV